MGIELLTLVDNTAAEHLQAEHGLAILLRGPGRTVLYDSGASEETFTGNCQKLGVDLAQVDSVVLSHGHSDHTGGLAVVAKSRKGLKIYAHPDAFHRRWAEKPGQALNDISNPHTLQRLRDLGAVIQPTSGPEMLEDWLVLSGTIGGPHHGPKFFVIRRGQGEMAVDGFEDENFLMAKGDAGWVVITGCCHRGLKNTLRAARFLTRDGKIVAIVGGFHLGDCSNQELDEVLAVLAEAGNPKIYPCHCTGSKAVEYLRGKLGDGVVPLCAGQKITF